MSSALDRLLDPLSRSLDAGAARSILAFRIDPALQDRIDELANRCNEGNLSETQRAEYKGYVEAVGLINILRLKALDALDTVSRA